MGSQWENDSLNCSRKAVSYAIKAVEACHSVVCAPSRGSWYRYVETGENRSFLIPVRITLNSDSEPLAIVLHPQQPLSYLERVIQSEVPPVVGEKGQWRPPAVSFISLQLDKDAIRPKRAVHEHHDVTVNGVKAKDVRRPNNDDRRHSERRYHRIHKETDKPSSYQHLREHGEKTVPSGEQFVRWSHSTEIGDFLRDASRACDFIVSIEGARAGLSQKIRVTVPTFNQRTYFLRMRLRKISRQLKSTAELKHECDVLAQRGAQRVAILGLFVLATWWCFVYVMTFQTELGWNTMEPVTYLVSLSSFMGGYLWFLYHNREISYKSALDFTVSARQRRLYQAKGVDLQLWGTLLDEGKTLRREIKSIAEEYDVDWNERADEQDEQVTQALKEKHHKSQVDGKRDTNEDGEEESK